MNTDNALLNATEASFKLRAMNDFIANGDFKKAAERADEAKRLLGTEADDNMSAKERARYRAEFSLIIARNYLVDGDTSNMADALLDGINGLKDLEGHLDAQQELKLAQLNYLVGLARLTAPLSSLDVTDGFEALDIAVELFDKNSLLGFGEQGLICAQTVRMLATMKLRETGHYDFIRRMGSFDEVERDLELLYHAANTKQDLEFQAIVVAHIGQRFFADSYRDDAPAKVKTYRGRLTRFVRDVRYNGWQLTKLALRLRWMKPDCQDPELWNLVRHSI